MKYSLRSLMIVAAVGPALLAGVFFSIPYLLPLLGTLGLIGGMLAVTWLAASIFELFGK